MNEPRKLNHQPRKIEHGIIARYRYWEIFEKLQDELGYADHPEALERYRPTNMRDPRLLRISNWLAEYPSPTVYPGAMDAVRQVQQSAPTVTYRMVARCSSHARWIALARGGHSMVTCRSTFIRNRNSTTSGNCIPLGDTG